MNLRRDNRIVVDLGKCQFARFYYRNQHGCIANKKAPWPTYGGKIVDEHEQALFHPDFPGETMLERLKRRGVLPDIWVPEALFKVSAYCCLIYTGEKASSLYKAWCERIFNSTTKKGKKE